MVTEQMSNDTPIRRPGRPTRTTSTPRANYLIELLGDGLRHESVAMTADERKAVQRLYGYYDEPVGVRPPEPVVPPEPVFRDFGWDRAKYEPAKAEYDRAKAAHEAWKRWKDPRAIQQAGADRNMLRYAGADGLRIVAWLARHVEPGQDPLKTIVDLAVSAGWDVDPEDVAWARGDDMGYEDGDAAEAAE